MADVDGLWMDMVREMKRDETGGWLSLVRGGYICMALYHFT